MSTLRTGWTRRRLRFDLDTNPKKSLANLDSAREVSFVPMDAVGELGGLDTSATKEVGEVYDGYTYFADGDVCIAKITPCFENGKGALAEGLTNGVGFGTTELHVLRPRDTLDAKFLFYLTIAHDFRRIGAAEMLGAGGQKRVPERFIKDWRPPLPPLETQRRIARFLDAKIARIDALIAKKRALLDRLAEKRQALITQAVTKGLDSSVPMKDSGIDWLGQIPAHWTVRRIKELGRLTGGTGFPHEYQGERDRELPFFKVADLGKIALTKKLTMTENTIDRDTAATLGASIMQGGDIVFAKVGAALLLNRFRVVGCACCVDNNMMTFRPSSLVSTDFALLAMSRINFSDIVNPGAVPSVNAGQVGEIRLAVPDPMEQRQIVEIASRNMQTFEAVADKVSSTICTLAEYRSALITAAVTGQLEIPVDGQADHSGEGLGKLAAEVA
ncbi:MAG: restriction endonuclease subunit S [Proteobacteria bacterium]|nr:restriction endonuclease subunit S [Pseudomonadota bacterium]